MISLPELNLLSHAEKDELIRVLLGQVMALTDQVNELTGIVTTLNGRLALNSANSSKPPSTNGFNKPNKTKSTRGKRGKKKGGQAGHQGHHLKPVAHPAHTEIHAPPQPLHGLRFGAGRNEKG